MGVDSMAASGPELSFGSATRKLPLIQNRWIGAKEHAVDELGWLTVTL
ncbi:hypothetical protein CLU88_1831 [Acidovorax sp. 56]|nr:hypothetical protein CLU88_1831 [Acidovorax sp. 56]